MTAMSKAMASVSGSLKALMPHGTGLVTTEPKHMHTVTAPNQSESQTTIGTTASRLAQKTADIDVHVRSVQENPVDIRDRRQLSAAPGWPGSLNAPASTETTTENFFQPNGGYLKHVDELGGAGGTCEGVVNELRPG